LKGLGPIPLTGHVGGRPASPSVLMEKVTVAQWPLVAHIADLVVERQRRAPGNASTARCQAADRELRPPPGHVTWRTSDYEFVECVRSTSSPPKPSSRPSVQRGCVQAPLAGDALELVFASIFEQQARACDQVPHG